MFNFNKKASAEIKKTSKEQYEELLKKNGIKPDEAEGFILGEKKEIYDSEMSLEDIINNHLFD